MSFNKLDKKTSVKIFLLLVMIILSIFFIKYLPSIITITVSLDKFNEYIVSMGNLGVVIFILFQVLQTVIAPIPGEVIQAAGGYIYGITLGSIYTMVGLVIGSAIAFYFTRFMGREFILNILKKKKFQWMITIMESKKFEMILFVIFIVPGLPKDFLIYVAALTSIKPIRFFMILTMSRLPWILASVSFGSSIGNENYMVTIVISIITVVSFIVGIRYKDKFINKFTKEVNKKGEKKIC